MYRRVGANRRRIRGVGAGGGPILLADYSSGTFSRASAATYWEYGSTLTRYSTNEARILSEGKYYCEGARTNLVINSAAITSTDNGSVTANQAANPDGSTVDAELFEATAAGQSNLYNNITNATVPDSVAYAASCFVEKIGAWESPYVYAYARAKDGTFSTSGSGTFGAGAADVSGWQRPYVVAATGVGAINCRSGIMQSTTSADWDAYVWGAQYEPSASFPSSHIETSGGSATRAVDDMLLPQASIDARFFTDPWSVTVTSIAAAAEWIADGAIGYIYYLDASNYLRLNADGKFAMATGGNVAVATLAGTWAAGADIVLAVDLAGGTLTTTGTGNDGEFSTTGAAWSAGDVEVGQAGAGATPWFGAISRPVLS